MAKIEMNPPNLNDVYVARERVAPHVPRTALLRHPLLDNAAGLTIWVKHENHNPTCAFKVRGGLNLVGAMTAEERAKGIVTASTGNHGQSIGLASRIHGVSCTVFVPDGNNPEKNAAMRAYGAIVEEGGKDFDEARERCERRAAETGARYVHSADEPLLIAGVGTYALEIFEELPDVDVRLDHRAKRARIESEDHRRGRGQRRCGLSIVERTAARGRDLCEHLCRGDCHARQLRPAVQHLQKAPG
jgi:threonine dehydratase